MRVEDGAGEARLTLSRDEVYLLRRALERATFVDTPPSEQEAIATFCARALEVLRSRGLGEKPL
jgi:hypothetical protein